MARKYDIIERLKAKNEKPFIRIDAEHCYTINTCIANVMHIMTLTQNIQNDTDLGAIEKIIELAIGKEAVEYINSQNFTLEALQLIMQTIVISFSGGDMEALDDLEVKSNEKK